MTPTPQRIRPDADEVTRHITVEPPARSTPTIAPDIPIEIDPGPVLGVEREPTGDIEDQPGTDILLSGSSQALTPTLVTSLQAVRGYPCVSILLSTCEGPRMDPADAARLERLRLNALARLRAEDLLEPESETVVALDRLVQQAMRSATHHGLALFAACGQAVAVPLPVEIEDRVVVDPSFATRDLVHALHRTPRHVVLVLTADQATLFDGSGGRLSPAPEGRFPMALDLAHADEARRPAALRAVDKALGAFLRLHPAPVVVAGPQQLVTQFCTGSANLARLAGTVYGGFADVGPEELARRTRPVLNRYLLSRQQAALDLLAERTRRERVASGIAAAWLAARTDRPEMLVVEEGYRYPARLSADGDEVQPASDIEAPDVVDDLVDELIEAVLDRGGWVALAHDGALAAHDRVALTVSVS